MLKSLSLMIATTALMACTTIEYAAPDTRLNGPDIEALAQSMTDVFETAPDDPDNDIRDHRVRVDAPALEGVWIYYQLNTGPERKVYRQRLIRLSLADDGDTIIQETFGLNDAAAYVDAWDNTGLLNALTPDDFDSYFDKGCEQRWRATGDNAWAGYVDPETCKIYSERRQANISIEAEAYLDDEAYRQTERGFDAQGEQLFGGVPGELIVLYRQ